MRQEVAALEVAEEVDGEAAAAEDGGQEDRIRQMAHHHLTRPSRTLMQHHPQAGDRGSGQDSDSVD